MAKQVIKKKIIASYSGIGVIFLVIFASIVANTILNSGEQEVTEDLRMNNENIYIAVDMLLDSVYISTHEAYANNSTIVKALYSNDLDKFERISVHEELKRMVYSSPILESIYIYNKHQNLVYSSLSAPTSPDRFYEENIYDIMEALNISSNIFMVRDVSFVNSFLNYDPHVISFSFTDNNKSNIGSSMIVNISKAKLNSQIYQNFLPGNAIRSFIIDDQGTLISHGDELLEDVHSDSSLINQILNDTNISGDFIGNVDGDKYMVSFTRSKKWGCVFVSIASYDVLISDVYAIIRIIGLLTVVLVMISTICALYMARSIYEPIEGLVNQVGRFNNLLTKKYSNEYDYVLQSIENMQSEMGTLANKVSTVEKNESLKKLLAGKGMSDQELNCYDLALDGPAYAVIVLKNDLFMTKAQGLDMNDMIAYRNKLSEIAYAHLSKQFSMELVEDGLEFVPIIINISDSRVNWLNDLWTGIEKVQDHFNKACDMTFTTGIGTIVFQLRELRDSFEDAIEATNYRLIYGNKAIITNHSFRAAKKREYAYPFNVETKIIKCLKLSKKQEINELLVEFSNEIIMFEYNEILLSYSQLLFEVIRIAKQMNYTMNKNLRFSYIDLQNRLNKCHTLQDINGMVSGILVEIINRQDQNTSNKNGIIVNRIKLYIENNYMNKDLCVEGIADMEQFSASHIRRMFKNNAGISLSEYINEVRFKKAEDLLRNTKYSAKKIADLCGFHSNDYFYYAFKRRMGITPTVFRKQKKTPLKEELEG